MKKYFLPLMLAAAAAASHAWPLQSAGDIAFTVDGAAFSAGNGLSWQQLYWSFPAREFTPAETLGQRLTRFRTEVTITDSAGNQALNEAWNSTAPLPTDAELKRKSLVRLDQIDARGLKSGIYRLKFLITDLVSARAGSLAADFEVPAYTADRLAISQIELATEIKPDSTEKRFRKGNLRVLPNPARVFDNEVALYYYFELYGLADPQGKRLKISYTSDNDTVNGTVSNDALTGAAGQAVEAGGFKLDELPDGGYELWAQVLDERGRPLAATSARFTVKRNPLAAMPGAENIQGEQEALKKEGGLYYDRIEYIANGRALATYEKLDSLGRLEFLRQFWKARDPDPKTPENEALREHVRRYEYANAEFGEHIRKGMEGSRTDRGRIYIKFGEPEEIDSKPVDIRYKPVIIWRYPGGKKFIFVDLSGFSRYQLEYTNVTGEHKDSNWQKYLSQDLIDAEGLSTTDYGDSYHKQ